MTLCATAVAVAGCTHSDGFVAAKPAAGPFNPGPDVRLTLNIEQDYWPTWTEDGAGILYAFIRPGVTPQHRCAGLLPAAGGSMLWQLCDDRAPQADSVNSFPSYALGADGRLLYAEAVSPKGIGATAPAELTLWLADSAHPFARRALFSFPGFAGATPVAWLADLHWTGPNTFIALAEDFTVIGHCRDCSVDSLFTGQAVVTGTITAAGATLTTVAGTAGASGYSLAENGATIVFTLRDDPVLYKVSSSGGTSTVVATLSQQLLGVSCKGSACVVASDPVTLSAAPPSGNPPVIFPGIQAGPRQLFSVSLTSGAAQSILSLGDSLIDPIIATPQVSPVTGDVVAQVGGAFGYLQSFTAFDSDLHLYQDLVH